MTDSVCTLSVESKLHTSLRGIIVLHICNCFMYDTNTCFKFCAKFQTSSLLFMHNIVSCIIVIYVPVTIEFCHQIVII